MLRHIIFVECLNLLIAWKNICDIFFIGLKPFAGCTCRYPLLSWVLGKIHHSFKIRINYGHKIAFRVFVWSVCTTLRSGLFISRIHLSFSTAYIVSSATPTSEPRPALAVPCAGLMLVSMILMYPGFFQWKCITLKNMWQMLPVMYKSICKLVCV